MGHKRSIPSDISTDRRFAALLEGDGGILAGLCYILGMVHADDWGRFTGDPVEFKLSCFPTAPANSAEIERALYAVAKVGLWQLYERDGRKVIQLPQDEFWQIQTYVGEERRKKCKSKFPPPPGMPDDRAPRKKGGEEADDDCDDEQNESDSGNDNQNLRKSTIIVHSHSYSHSHSHSHSHALSHSDSLEEQGLNKDLNKDYKTFPHPDADLVRAIVELATKCGIRLQRRTAVELLGAHGMERVLDALAITAGAESPTMRYLRSVLNRWQEYGGMPMEYTAEMELAELKRKGKWPPEPFRRWFSGHEHEHDSKRRTVAEL